MTENFPMSLKLEEKTQMPDEQSEKIIFGFVERLVNDWSAPLRKKVITAKSSHADNGSRIISTPNALACRDENDNGVFGKAF